MSTRPGQLNRNRAQKHQNSLAWNPNKFKTDPKAKLVSSITVTNCCAKCTEVIEWKVKYGKYKPLTQPAKCTKCGEKRVKSAYHIICVPCVRESGCCAKCGSKEDIVNPPEPSVSEASRLEAELQTELKALPERKRRTFLRYLRQQEQQAKPKGNKAVAGGSKSSTDNPAAEGESGTVENQPKSLVEIRREAKEYLKELKEAVIVDKEDSDLDSDFDDEQDSEEDQDS